MRRALLALAALAAAAICVFMPAPAAADDLELTPVVRLPFPERGYIIDLQRDTAPAERNIEVRENGAVVSKVRVSPAGESGLRFGVVLAIDASESMWGEPSRAALDAARAFLAHRRPNEQVGIVAFNGQVTVLEQPTRDDAALRAALQNPLRLRYGTRIYDALAQSVALLRRARVSAGSIVLLSDGADVGSVGALDHTVAQAHADRIRIFTVGLRSGAFDASTLRSIADRTGGSSAEARSAEELEGLYADLGRQLAGEYLIRYRSDARPGARVDVRILVGGTDAAGIRYTAPTPAALPPYHRSLLSRFMLSSVSLVFAAVVVAMLSAWMLVIVLRGPKRTIVARIGRYSSGGSRATPDREWLAAGAVLVRSRYASGIWARLERDLEIARIQATPRQVGLVTLSATVVFMVVLLLVSPALALASLAVPLAARAWIRHKLKQLRNQFADQFPPNLQVLASALRAGHSFSGALGVVVENAHEPARSELRRVHNDDRLGIPPEKAIRTMAERMANRDVEQVALLAELQRTAGGNSAEVLDTVVDTIRERGELRRLVRTLTAQGRMARWILTALPIGVGGFLFLIQPDVMREFVSSGGGQVALVIAVLMVAAGSMVIQRIIEIDV